MIKAIRIHAHGGPDMLRLETIEIGPPGPGEARVRHTAIGVNYSDVNVRRGGFYLAHNPAFPLILGNEAAGIVERVGEGVQAVRPGDRVAYAAMHGEFFEDTGSYCEERNVPVERLVKLPPDISERDAAAMMVKGFTAGLIVNDVYRPKSKDIILIHAAASGVGSLLVQWSKHFGATVIGTVGSREKAEIARNLGCDHVIPYRETDFVEAVKGIAPQGVTAVFDGVGKDTFLRSLECVRRLGWAVNYGNASGHVPPFNLMLLAYKSISICRTGLGTQTRDVDTMKRAAMELFDLSRRGVLKVRIGETFPLAHAADAHRAIEQRSQAGSILLIP